MDKLEKETQKAMIHMLSTCNCGFTFVEEKIEEEGSEESDEEAE